MAYFDWDWRKNEKLKLERDISFEEVLIAIERGGLLDILEHPQRQKYPRQKMLVVRVDDYAYLVPFVADEEKVFLKTIIPSRKATKHYIIQKKP